jgi:hypothetical protein
MLLENAIIMPMTINSAHKKDPKSLTNYQFFHPILSANYSSIYSLDGKHLKVGRVKCAFTRGKRD